MTDIADRIDDLWARRQDLSPDDGDARATVDEAIALLDAGDARVAEMTDRKSVV